MSAENLQALRPSMAKAAALAPGIILSAMVAAIGYIAAPYVAKAVPIPNMVIALVVGIALNPMAARPAVHAKTHVRYGPIADIGRNNPELVHSRSSVHAARNDFNEHRY